LNDDRPVYATTHKLLFISYCIVVLCGKKNNNNSNYVIGYTGDLCVTKGKRWF